VAVTAKFRQSMAVPLAALVAFLGASALATQRWWLLPLLLVPAAVFWWGFRAGVDADRAGLRVRGLVGSRAVPWPEVAGFRVDGRRVLLSLRTGGELPLPAVAPGDVSRLVEASGGAVELGGAASDGPAPRRGGGGRHDGQ
jgi:hypothetical protein